MNDVAEMYDLMSLGFLDEDYSHDFYEDLPYSLISYK